MIDIASGEDDYVNVREELLKDVVTLTETPCDSCKEVLSLSQLILREIKESREIEKVNSLITVDNIWLSLILSSEFELQREKRNESFISSYSEKKNGKKSVITL